jgi:N-acetylneuraminic acid mutarotase
MTDQRELDRLLGAYFVEGTNELADRVIDAALDQIDHTPQRRAVRAPWRFPTMNMPVRVATAAVIGVLAVGGTIYLIRPDRPAAGGPSPAAGASASPGQSASPSPRPSQALVPQPAPAWTSTGDMVAPHGGSGHTATLLLDGKVLVAGGYVGYPEGFTASAELYDPGTGAWTATGNMTHGRGGPATLLQDGRVLVAGWDGGDAPNGTELYDPGTGTWAATGNTIAVVSNTATLLPDGKVLITGPMGDNMASAELYLPGTGKWTATGRMTATQVVSSATLLLDGKVLVIGYDWVGVGDNQTVVAACELYDPNTGTWTATGKSLQPREEFTATATLLQNGKVLVAGGHGTNGDLLAAAELYDPDTGTWTATGTMIEGRYSHTATLLQDGKVLVVGGHGHDTLASAELYNPETGTWTATASMANERAGKATPLRDGKVLVTGGGADRHTLDSAELYDPGSGN